MSAVDIEQEMYLHWCTISLKHHQTFGTYGEWLAKSIKNKDGSVNQSLKNAPSILVAQRVVIQMLEDSDYEH